MKDIEPPSGDTPSRTRDNKQHGTHSRYVQGCRCDECREAKRAYMAQWRKKKKTRALPSVGQVIVDVWNDVVPIGSPVHYWPGILGGDGAKSVTRSQAWLLGGHTPVVLVEGYSGGIALTHVISYPPSGGDA